MHSIKYILIFILINVVSFTVSASVFSENQIKQIVDNEQVTNSSKDFVRKFFVSNNPKQYIADFVANKVSDNDGLLAEYQLFNLLNEVAYHPKQQFLQDFVDDMQQYSNKSFKYHQEGNLQIPVFAIQNRAKGIENIWLADESYQNYRREFNNNPIATIKSLQNKTNSMSAPQWLGLKNNIEDLTAESHVLITDYLLANINNLSGLDKFVSHYALLTANKELTRMAILNLDKSNSEYMLRKLPEYFATDFVIEQLIAAVQNNKNSQFAISMMKPLVDKSLQVSQLLISLLADKTLSSQAAFALSATQNIEVLNQLKNLHNQSQSAFARQQVIFALKMNQSQQAQNTLRLLTNGKSNQWLNSFKGDKQ